MSALALKSHRTIAQDVTLLHLASASWNKAAIQVLLNHHVHSHNGSVDGTQDIIDLVSSPDSTGRLPSH